MENLFDLTGKTAVVIGGNSTLGSTIAMGLANHGAKVALVARSLDKVKEVEQSILDAGGAVKAFQAEATNKNSLEKVASEIEAWAGGFDILLNSAGTNSPTPFFEIEESEWDRIMSVNLKATVLACQVFAQKMIQYGKGGSIINVSSVSSTTPLSKVFTYSVSKAGINSVTEFLAREFAPHNIRVNAIIPGFFTAEQNRKVLTPDRVESIMRHTPMNRFGNPKELQGAVIWLASERASSFVTGALIRIDGGFGAMTI